MVSQGNTTKRGFTLIELMVVITIIGLLASTLLASMQSARAAGRDAKLKNDIRQIQNALELYRNANQSYPLHGTNTQLDELTGAGGTGDIRPFINPIPNNPHPGQTGAAGYRYYRATTGSAYTLLFRLHENNFAWCSVSMGGGHPSWNYSGGVNYPPCF